jgi:hypothetical protein
LTLHKLTGICSFFGQSWPQKKLRCLRPKKPRREDEGTKDDAEAEAEKDEAKARMIEAKAEKDEAKAETEKAEARMDRLQKLWLAESDAKKKEDLGKRLDASEAAYKGSQEAYNARSAHYDKLVADQNEIARKRALDGPGKFIVLFEWFQLTFNFVCVQQLKSPYRQPTTHSQSM